MSDFRYPVTPTRTCGGAGVAFDDLGIEPLSVDGPGAATLTGCLSPCSERGGPGLAVERQAIAGKDGDTAGCQALSDLVDPLRGHGLGARAEGESRDDLGAGVTGDPQPGDFGRPS